MSASDRSTIGKAGSRSDRKKGASWCSGGYFIGDLRFATLPSLQKRCRRLVPRLCHRTPNSQYAEFGVRRQRARNEPGDAALFRGEGVQIRKYLKK